MGNCTRLCSAGVGGTCQATTQQPVKQKSAAKPDFGLLRMRKLRVASVFLIGDGRLFRVRISGLWAGVWGPEAEVQVFRA